MTADRHVLDVARGAACVVAFTASYAAFLRLRRLKALQLLPPNLAGYFAPITDGPVFVLSGPFQSLRTMNLSRMRQGRMLKLLVGRAHRDIGDPWLTRLVYTQRIALLLFFASFVALPWRARF